MAKIRWSVGLLAGCLLLGGAVASAQTPTPAQMLQSKPRQSNVDYTVPGEAEVPACEVKEIKGGAGNGWLVVDPRGKPLRRVFTYNAGGQRVTVYSFYKDGLEVYREIDSNGNNKVDEYRWFNSGGMKWGTDPNEDGAIDSWKMISEEEAAQEAFQAVVTNDFARLKALFITEAELTQLGLPAPYIQKINDKLKAAPAKFQETAAKVKVANPAKTTGRVESAAPSCVPGESIGTTHDLFRYPSLAILYEASAGKHEWLQTGEMVKVGMAWRLIDVPTAGPDGTGGGGGPDVPNPIMEEIAKLDQRSATETTKAGINPATVAYYLERVNLINKLLPTLKKSEDLESWYKQKGDNLQSAALASPENDTRAVEILRQFKSQVVQQSPTNPLAGYLSYRVLWSEWAPKLSNAKENNMQKVQAEWLEKLATFVKDYPKAEDTPDSLIQLAMGSEFGSKEDEAKRWYGELVKNFPQHQLAPKAEGAIRRLNLVGNRMTLTANTLDNQPFNLASLQGKVAVVYYWANYCTTCPADFAKLKKLHDEYKSKGFEIVSVNLDAKAADAQAFLQANPLPQAVHLFAATPDGQMESPLAVQYGIMGLPAMFLVGKDGNVISRSIQINDLEDAIRKAQ